MHTLGCRLNQAESEETTRALRARGLDVDAGDGGVPDVVVVNTCTVTSDASKSSRKLVRSAGESGARVVVTGCYAVADPDTVAALPGVAAVVANKDKDDLAATVASLPGVVSAATVGSGTGPDPQVRGSFKVQTGCDEACTFCVIPSTRGGLSSRNADAVVAGIRAQVASGAAEVTLTGVHLGKFGTDRGEAGALAPLLTRILHDVPDLRRLRLSSIECGWVDDDLLTTIADEDRLCAHLHVPLQSGASGTLARMRRPYDPEAYRAVVRRIRRALGAECGLTTDVLVGFPGETEADFAATLAFVEETAFTKLHVFRYSPRPGTPAAAYPDQVPEDVKRERSRRLRHLGDTLSARFHAGLVGRVLGVVVERAGAAGAVAPAGAGERHVRPTLVGTAANYVKVASTGPAGLVGRIVDVRVTAASASGVVGDIPEENLR